MSLHIPCLRCTYIKCRTILLYLIVLPVFFIVAFCENAHGSHFTGADFEFKSLGVDTFKITLRIYRDCDHIAPANTSSINLYTIGCSPIKSASVTVNKVGVRKIKSTCDGVKTICEGGSYSVGIEEHKYEAVVMLQQIFQGGLNSNCCWIGMYYQECCRNMNITNIQGGTFLIEGEFNRCITPSNSSPTFKNDPFVNICNGQLFNFNNGVQDTIDNDSISCELISSLIGFGQSSIYNPGFSPTIPLQCTGLQFDAASGDLRFTPTSVQVPSIAYRYNEWRKINGYYQKISSIVREHIFYVTQCSPNNPPVLTINGAAARNATIEICAGMTTCYLLKSTDKDSSSLKRDTTLIKLLNPKSGISFNSANSPVKTIREDSAMLCWTPGINEISNLPYIMYLSIEDNNCPVKAQSSYAVSFYVKESTALLSGYITQNRVTTYRRSFDFIRTDNVTTPVTYEWTVSNTSNGVFTPNNSRTYLNKQFSHNFPSNGRFVVRLRLNPLSCPKTYYDTVEICNFGFSISSIADSVSCNGGNDGRFTVNFSGGTSPYWYRADNMNFQQSNVLTHLKTGVYRILVQDSMECLFSISDTIFGPPKLKVNYATDSVLCFNGASGQLTISASGGVPPYTHSLNNSPFVHDTLFKQLSANTYQVVVKDSKQCTDTNSVVVPQPTFYPLKVNKTNVLICHGDSTGSFTLSVPGTTRTPVLYSVNASGFSSQQQYPDLPAGKYYITAKDSRQCEVYDSVFISEPTKMFVNLNTSDVKCKNGNDGTITVNATGGSGTYNFSLNNGPFQWGNTFSNLTRGVYTVSVIDLFSCPLRITDSISEPIELITDSIQGSSFVAINSNASYTVNANRIASFLWSVQGGQITAGQNTNTVSVLWPATSGNAQLAVIALDQNNCSDTTFKQIVIQGPSSITKQFAQLGLMQVYPNPFQDELKVIFTHTQVASGEVRIYNLMGELIKSQLLEKGTKECLVDLAELASSVYLLEYCTENNCQRVSLIKQ